ncbi:MAG: DUF6515 family protein [Syntrophales bacterium LBB04]|nr:DUF6515 family protein [Syntrophales bacterium LBB04]
MSTLRPMHLPFLVLLLLSGMMMVGFFQEAGAEEREFRHHHFMDSRYHHDHYYPARGQVIEVLPSGHRMVVFGRDRFYFFDGVWYRSKGRRFLVVAPPIGLAVPFLPPFYTTIMVGGVPHYYANEVYYAAASGGYVVVTPPRGDIIPVPPAAPQPLTVPSPGPPVGSQMPGSQIPGGQMPGTQMPGEQIFIYPRQGQNEKKQAEDRYECHRWAVGQTGYDPTKPPVGMTEVQLIQKRGDYQRAMGACFDARGYSSK